MPFTRGAREVPNQTPASTSDATDLPPSLPDTSGWVRREPGDVIPKGARYFYYEDAEVTIESGWTVGPNDHILTPPPVEPAPWECISTDREQPTLAKVTWGGGTVEYETTALLFVEDGYVCRVNDSTDPHGSFGSQKVGSFDEIVRVELLHTHNPVTHVPVERALIERLLNLPGSPDSLQYRDELASVRNCLAALADGAKS